MRLSEDQKAGLEDKILVVVDGEDGEDAVRWLWDRGFYANSRYDLDHLIKDIMRHREYPTAMIFEATEKKLAIEFKLVWGNGEKIV